MLVFACSHCGHGLSVQGDGADSRVRCPKCGAVNCVPISAGYAGGASPPRPHESARASASPPVRPGTKVRLSPVESSGKLLWLVIFGAILLVVGGIAAYTTISPGRPARPKAPQGAAKDSESARPAAPAVVPQRPNDPAETLAAAPPVPGDSEPASVARGPSPAPVSATLPNPESTSQPDKAVQPEFFGGDQPVAGSKSGSPATPQERSPAAIAVAHAVGSATSRPVEAAIDPKKARLAEDFWAVAQSAKTPADLIDALRRVIGLCPDHLPANLKLAETLISQRQIDPSVDQIEKLQGLVGQDQAAQAKLAELKSSLGSLRVHAARWTALCKQTAEKYGAVAEQPATEGLPSRAAALKRASVLTPDDKALADRWKEAEGKIPVSPDAGDQPDAKGAKLLAERADVQTRQGHHDEAARLLQDAYSLNPDDPVVMCDLASSWVKTQKPAPAAAMMVRLRQSLSDPSTQPERKALIPRVEAVLGQADPTLHAVEQLDKDFAAAGKAIRQTAQIAADLHLSADISKCLGALFGPEAGAGGVVVAAAGGTKPPAPVPAATKASKIDFMSKDVEIHTDNSAEVKRFTDGLVLGHMGPGDGKKLFDVALVTLGDRTFKGDWRVGWRVQTDHTGQGGATHVCFFPISESSQGCYLSVMEVSREKRWRLCYEDAILKPNGYEYQQASKSDMSAAYKDSGDYIVTFQKKGNVVSAWVDQTRMIDFKLNDAQLQRAAALPMKLRLITVRDDPGQLKIGSAEFRVGG